METTRAWSAAILVDLIAHLGPQLDDAWAGLDLEGLAAIDVAWAEPGTVAPVWLDVARELSEFWIHQQQVRDAVGAAGSSGADGDQVAGAAARSWVATRRRDRWHLSPANDVGDCDAAVQLSADTLWRVASRGISPDVAAGRAVLTGDGELARAALNLFSIIR